MFFVRLLLLSLALHASPSSLAAGEQEPAREVPPVYLEGFDAAARTQVEAAYQNLLRDPDNPALNGRLGMRFHAYDEYPAAARWYRRAHRLDPDSFDWAYLLAVAKLAGGEPAKAVPLLRNALTLNPDYQAAWIKLGEALLEAGRVGESLEAYRTTLEKWPGSWPAHYGVGRVLLLRKEVEAAVESLRRATEAPDGYGAAHYSLALALRDLGRKEEARRHFELYQQTQNRRPVPEDPLLQKVAELKSDARHVLAEGVRLARQEQFEAAVKAHESALQLDPGLAQAHVNLIRLYGELKRFDKAEEHYRTLVQLDSNQPEGHYNFGVVCSSQGRFQEAAEAFGKAIGLNPHFALAHNNLGYMREREGKLETALSHYREAVRNDPGYRLARFNLGRALVALGRAEEAIPELEKTLQPEDKETPRYQYALSAAYVRAGQLEPARRHAEAAREAAARWGQDELVAVIERDLRRLEKAMNRP